MANNYYTNKIIKLTVDQYKALKNGSAVDGYKYNSNDAFLLDIQSLIDKFYTKDEITNLLNARISSGHLAAGGKLGEPNRNNFYIIFPGENNSTTFSFQSDNTTYNGHHIGFFASGTPGLFVYFNSSNPVHISTAKSIEFIFSSAIYYIKISW